MSDAALQSLAELAGLLPHWLDYRNEAREVSPEVLRQVLKSLGYPTSSAGDVQHSRVLLGKQAEWPLLTADAGSSVQLPPRFAAISTVELLHEESGLRTTLAVGGVAHRSITVPQQPGYYHVQSDKAALRVAVAPKSCLPDYLQSKRRWGLTAQLYSLRREGDVGFGDFTALITLAQWAGGRGADALAISPVHALYSAEPSRFSPYSPSSRLFLNVLYGDPDSLAAQRPVTRSSEAVAALVDWPVAAAQRLAALRAAHRQWQSQLIGNGALAEAFSAFTKVGGVRLLDHARFEAISAFSCRQGGYCSWQEWPAALRDPRSAAVEAFAYEQADEVQFQLFAQWLAARGLDAAQQAARDAGMAIGLIGDLAVGTDSGGSHAWSLQDAMLQGLSIGAPPDLLAGQGQNWGLTTFSPVAMLQQGFAPFIELLRANLRHVGGLRVDHILGLKRLWLTPHGASAADGVYLNYPFDDLLRLIRLEAWRHGALMIGEDLGTVPEGLRQHLQDSGVLGMRVLWFERDHGLFVEPQRWSANAVATTTTHDLPTVAGWWQGRDLDWRARAAQFSEGSDEAKERAERAEDQVRLWAALQHQSVTDASATPQGGSAALNAATIRFVARAPSLLALIPMEDLLGVVEQPNVPGTTDEHPNWQRRLPVPVEALSDDAAAMARSGDLQKERPRL